MENKRIIQIRGAKEHNLKGVDLDIPQMCIRDRGLFYETI